MNRKPIRWKAALACAAALILAGCASQENAEEGTGPAAVAEGEAAQSARNLKMAETAWLSVSAQGEVFTTFLDSDGRYRDVNDGGVRFSGAWEQDETGQLCFTPDTGPADGPPQCWEHGAPGLGGIMRATNDAGRAIELKQVAYTPPAPAARSQPDESDPTAASDGASGAASDAQAGGRG